MKQHVWDLAHFYCMEHELPVAMQLNAKGNYECPRCYPKDEDHPFGHQKDEDACCNSITSKQAQAIIERYEEKKLKDFFDQTTVYDNTNYRYKVGLYVTVQILPISLLLPPKPTYKQLPPKNDTRPFAVQTRKKWMQENAEKKDEYEIKVAQLRQHTCYGIYNKQKRSVGGNR